MTQEIINNLQELQAFAARIYNSGKKIICLEGDLGAGKTEFARALINYAAKKETKVSSPTYNIVQIYELEGNKIYHFDLYRLESEDELPEIGLDDALNDGICLIEWPQIAQNVFKTIHVQQLINLKIEIINEDVRRITIA